MENIARNVRYIRGVGENSKLILLIWNQTSL